MKKLSGIGLIIGGALLSFSIYLLMVHWDEDRRAEKIAEVIQPFIKEKMEWAYYEGQREALSGDVRILKTDSGWVRMKSAWNQDTNKYFKPAKQ